MVDKKAEIQYIAPHRKKLADIADSIMQKRTGDDWENKKVKNRDALTSVEIPDFKLAALGIPPTQIANLPPEVSETVAALLGKIDQLTDELSRARENLTELEQLVDVDCLAPIPNRRAFMRRLEWAISMHERYNFPVSVLYFDLNNLKEINDTYGHSAGDAAIRHVSSVLSSGTRESDFIARIGGDEFAIILFHSDFLGASRRADTLAGKFKNSPLNWDGHEIQLSAACGVYSVQAGDTPETALIAADTAMYEDKRRMKSEHRLEGLPA